MAPENLPRYGSGLPSTWKPGKHERHRIIIYAKDIQLITGKSERYGRMMLRRVREYFQKADHQLVTVQEFCEYAGLQIELVNRIIL